MQDMIPHAVTSLVQISILRKRAPKATRKSPKKILYSSTDGRHTTSSQQKISFYITNVL